MDPLGTEFKLPEKKARTIDYYPLRAWITTLFFGPVLFVLAASAFNGSNFLGYVLFALLFFACSLILTLPFLCIYWYLYDVLKDKELRSRKLRIILCLIVSVMILLTFELFKSADFEDFDTSVFLCSYIAANIATTFSMRISAKTQSIKMICRITGSNN